MSVSSIRESRNLQHLQRQQSSVQQWIESVLNETFDEELTFRENLKTGEKLCECLNLLRPNSIQIIRRSHLPFKHMENVSNFLRALKDLGLKERDLFEANDLVQGKNMGRVVR